MNGFLHGDGIRATFRCPPQSKLATITRLFEFRCLKSAIARYERKAEVKGSCSDNAIGHIWNDVSRDLPEKPSDFEIERNNSESVVFLGYFVLKSLESISGDAPAFH
jgi:hypothetical protein